MDRIFISELKIEHVRHLKDIRIPLSNYLMVKIQRSFPAPASLETESRNPSGGSYSEADVIQQLKEDFHDKCYICELRELQDPEVEHLLPHKNRTYPGSS